MNKYEQLIEHIINDEEGKARALFHDIVVEKSRQIYESLMDEDYTEEDISGDKVSDMVDEITMDETDGIGEGHGEDDLEMDLGDHDGEEGMDDMSHMGHEGEEDLEAKVMDLESELEALKAEFEQLMADEENEPEHHDGMEDPDFGHDEEEEDEGSEEDEMMEAAEEEEDEDEDEDEMTESVQRKAYPKTAVDLMREYVEKISTPSNTEFTPVGTGAGGDKASGNTKEIVAGKNDMGGSAKNLAQGGAENAPDGTSANPGQANEYKKGKGNLPGAGKFENVPGANAGKAFAKKEKAKAGEGQTTDGSVPTNKRSIEQGGN